MCAYAGTWHTNEYIDTQSCTHLYASTCMYSVVTHSTHMCACCVHDHIDHTTCYLYAYTPHRQVRCPPRLSTHSTTTHQHPRESTQARPLGWQGWQCPSPHTLASLEQRPVPPQRADQPQRPQPQKPSGKAVLNCPTSLLDPGTPTRHILAAASCIL